MQVTEAGVELHETVGPARTTVSTIAEKAGAPRHTYYAHFTELKDLYPASLVHYIEGSPVPDPSRSAQLPEPEARLRVALSEVYACCSRDEAIWPIVLRDAPLDPVTQ